MRTIEFHAFPRKKQKQLRQMWIAMVNRENWEPSTYARLCSIHFVGLRGPTEQHPIPTLFDYNDYGGMLRCKPPAAYQADGSTAKGKSNVIILIIHIGKCNSEFYVFVFSECLSDGFSPIIN